MKVLIVARCKNGRYAPFITEQVDALEKQGIECRFFGVQRKGVLGYLRRYPELIKTIRIIKPDVVHAHYGLSGVFANLQRKVPVVTTFHGSDINDPVVRRWSKCAIRLSAFCIFVSTKNLTEANPQKNYALIPCGINMQDYPIINREDARHIMGLAPSGKYVLFAGAFDNPVKNSALAKEAVELLPGVELIELKGYNRNQVATLMQAVDVFLMTSLTEGSPQVIKEAMACGCPIVSVDVGDVKEITDGVDGCYLADREPKSIADNLNRAFAFSGRTKGREVIIEKKLTNDIIANQILAVYRKVAK